jgi:putative ABC transport system ATP-binding protein
LALKIPRVLDFWASASGSKVVRPLVEAIGLCKHYTFGESLVHAVSNVSLIVHQGEFVSICGRSGSGKSTLMNLLGLLERAGSGQYFLNGKEVAVLGGRARTTLRNREIGFVFQLPTLLPRASALENVELPLAYAGLHRLERQLKARDALDRVGLRHRWDYRPNQLSGGEQQRVAIARALVNKPALLLADEPTGALDSKTSDEIMSLFEELHREGATIIVVTHAPDVAERTLRRITLHDGCIVGDTSDEKQVPPLREIAPWDANELC